MSLKQLVASIGRLSSGEFQLFTTHLLIHGTGKTVYGFHTSVTALGKMKFIKLGIDLTKYSLRPLPLTKSGGRGADGRIQVHGVGGGHRQRYRQVDFVRSAPKDGPPITEKVTSVRYDPCRTADIAVVARGEKKRYIIASENMKAGDLIKTSGIITRVAVHGQEGDAHPLGALAVGTLVHSIERYAGDGGTYARAAGTCGLLVRKVGDRCVVKLPSKREINVSQDCMATVGRVSNIDHNKEHIGSAGRSRWFGIRPQSGFWHKKTGYNGRKIRPTKPMVTYEKPKRPKPEVFRLTV